MITIVGLGVEKGDLTQKGKEAILTGGKVILRTAQSESAKNVIELKIPYESLDSIYEKSRNFSSLTKNLADYIIEEGKKGDVVYCIDGTVSEDSSAQKLLKSRMPIRVVEGVSKISAIASCAKMENSSYTAFSAYDLKEEKGFSLPLIIYDIDNEFLAGDVKLFLSEVIGEEKTINYVQKGQTKKIKIYQLDRQKEYDYTSAVVVNLEKITEKARYNLQDLIDIIHRLRRPDGCPWDKVQTNESIKMNMIEEAYELVDAIDLKDDEKMQEETGDVLLQAVFHTVMKEEQGAYTLTDVLTQLCEKLIYRHSHIFGTDKAQDEATALSVWEENKKKEKHQQTFSDAVNDVPKCFPAAMRAQKVQKRAGKSAFDFSSPEEAMKKVYEEISELEEAEKEKDKQHIAEELGDLLFAVVNVGRLCGVDCEQSLKETTEKFAKRFTQTEQLIIADKKEITSLSEKELDDYYKIAKKNINESNSK